LARWANCEERHCRPAILENLGSDVLSQRSWMNSKQEKAAKEIFASLIHRNQSVNSLLVTTWILGVEKLFDRT
jgi:hypothetical protein